MVRVFSIAEDICVPSAILKVSFFHFDVVHVIGKVNTDEYRSRHFVANGGDIVLDRKDRG